MSVWNNDHRTRFKDVSKSFVAVAASDPVVAPFIAGRAKYTLFITRIVVEVTTAAAKIWTFRDSAGTPVVIAVLPASAAVGDRHVLLDSTEGVALTEGKDLNWLTDGAGVAGSLIVEGYLKPTATMTPADI